MFEGLRDQLPGGVAMTRLTVQCGIGEGTIATIMETVQAAHEGVSIGSYPWFKPGQFGTAAVVSGLDPHVTMAAAEALAAGVRDLGAAAEIMPLGEGGGG
jgi:molybdopterin-biosynthesis enzyme MoeA-like protein